MTLELDNQIIMDLVREKYKNIEADLKAMTTAITELYKSLRGFWGLLAGIANNRLMIIQSAIPPLFQTTEIKAKIEESEGEYNEFLSAIQRLDSVWAQLFKTTDYSKLLMLMGRLQEILDEIYTHEERFLKLTDEIWKEYLEWKKEREKEIK